MTDKALQDRVQKNPGVKANLVEVRKQIREQVKSIYQLVPPGSQSRPYHINLGSARFSLHGQPLYLRIKFNAADNPASGTLQGIWRVGVPQKTRLWQSEVMSLAPDTFHEFEIPPDLFDANGLLTVTFGNPNDIVVLFPLEDGLEVLFRESGFGLNFVRGLGIIFCWMALLAALGLAAASFLSFPVAAFCALGVLTMGLSSGTMSGVLENGTITDYNAEKGGYRSSLVDVVVLPVFKAALTVIRLAKDFSPVDALSTGRSITWTQLGLAFSQIVLLLGGCMAFVGISAFTRRELATAQGTQ
jgi:hypothetical protein